MKARYKPRAKPSCFTHSVQLSTTFGATSLIIRTVTFNKALQSSKRRLQSIEKALVAIVLLLGNFLTLELKRFCARTFELCRALGYGKEENNKKLNSPHAATLKLYLRP
jgi:hypothetical protein